MKLCFRRRNTAKKRKQIQIYIHTSDIKCNVAYSFYVLFFFVFFLFLFLFFYALFVAFLFSAYGLFYLILLWLYLNDKMRAILITSNWRLKLSHKIATMCIHVHMYYTIHTSIRMYLNWHSNSLRKSAHDLLNSLSGERAT